MGCFALHWRGISLCRHILPNDIMLLLYADMLLLYAGMLLLYAGTLLVHAHAGMWLSLINLSCVALALQVKVAL